MTYRVTLDDKSQIAKGAMETTWMKAAGQNGIPTAFIINQQNVIAWIGSPSELEQTLNDILSGQFDISKFAAKYEKSHKEDQIFEAKNKKIFTAINQKKWDGAQSALDALLKDYPQFQNSYAWPRLTILFGQKKYDTAYQFIDSFAKAHPTDYNQLNEFAWMIATQDGIEQRNLSLAKKLAEQAITASHGKDSDSLDTLARIQFMQDDKQHAITTEQKAIAVASVSDDTDSYQKNLTAYQQGRLPDAKN